MPGIIIAARYIKEPSASLTVGEEEIVRIGRGRSLVVQDGQAPYDEMTYGGNCYHAANQAAVTFGAGLSATVATFALYNPASSGRLMVPLWCQFVFSAAPAAATVIGYAAQTGLLADPTGVTALTVNNSFLGYTSGELGPALGRAYSAATLTAAPTFRRFMVSVVAASSITPPLVNDDIKGGLELYPGTVLAIQATAAAAGFISMGWHERPL